MNWLKRLLYNFKFFIRNLQRLFLGLPMLDYISIRELRDADKMCEGFINAVLVLERIKIYHKIGIGEIEGKTGFIIFVEVENKEKISSNDLFMILDLFGKQIEIYFKRPVLLQLKEKI